MDALLTIIVVGAGKVGFEIALRLSQEGHDIVVVDKDEGALQEVAGRLDVMTISGNGASTATLEQANVSRAQIVVAVTDIDEVNMVACMAAKQYGVPTCVARIRNPDYTTDHPRGLPLQSLGVDLIIDPERLAAQEIGRLLDAPLASDLEYFADGQVVMMGLRIDAESQIAGRTLADCALPDCLIVAVDRGDKLEIPRGNTVVEAGNRVFVVGRTADFQEIRALLGTPAHEIRNVAIVGGSRIGQQLVDLIHPRKRTGVSLALFEKNPVTAQELAKRFPHLLVIEGDATKIDILRDEGGASFDALVAVTGEDHTNLLATMLAKELGVSEVISKISREDYAPLASRAGADAVVVPRLLTVSSVLRLVRKSEIVSMSLLKGGAETLEFSVSATCRMADHRLREVSFPTRALVGAIFRAGDVIIPNGASRVVSGDRVVVFAMSDAVDEVATFFQG